MTSAGGARVLPAYGAVSAAKAALESHVRQLALELGRGGVAVNAIRAGVTDTPASRKIPGAEVIFAEARRRNPGGRLTAPDDVAQAIVALCQGPSTWLSGNVIGVDGGEDVVGTGAAARRPPGRAPACHHLVGTETGGRPAAA
jgi:enoyl-[acyl-carrier-protein] reductase (NADH)